VAAQTQHPHVHLPAASNDRNIRRHRAVDENAALVGECSLTIDRQILSEMENSR
jgi:hypothetical protein